MAGVEPNPGPFNPNICPVCNLKVNWTSQSVLCSKCKAWCHVRKQNNCSGLTNTRNFNQNTWHCPKCAIPTATSVPVTESFKILQFNCNGLRNKVIEIVNWMKEKDIKIAAFQETKLNEDTQIKDIGNYTLIRKDRTKDAGGGVAFLIHNSVKFQQLPDIQDPHIEFQAIQISNLTIANIYIPPTGSCTQGYVPSIDKYFSNSDALILGDFNAHDALWHSSLQDARGSLLAEEIGNSNFGVLNSEKATRVPTNGQPTSPDISLASYSLLPVTEWDTATTFSSDHLPIIITISASIDKSYSEKKTFINFNKAKWDDFTMLTEEEFSKLPEPSDVYKAEKQFRKIVNKVSKHCIPAGRIKEVYPEIPTEAARMMETRDNLRSTNPSSEEIKRLNSEISSLILDHKKEKWRKTVEEIRPSSSKLFKLIKRLNGKSVNSGNQPIKFKGKYISCPTKAANNFNKQYSAVVHHKSSRESRNITENIRKNNLDNPHVHSDVETKEAIKKSKASKAIGPDKICNLHLKHLGKEGISYLTKIFNLSIKHSQIPAIWKQSIIIPLLKPGKDPADSKSYRPVSLLCPAIKILERLALPMLNSHLKIPSFQHGFRKNHSTITALNDFNEQVCDGFNKKQPPDRTLLVQLDLSKAFDMVNHDKLLKGLDSSDLPPHMKRWLNCYLKGRQSKVQFRNKLSSSRNVRTGVPQGAVTSPLLFCFYLANIPDPPEDIYIIQYADDISIYTSGVNIQALSIKVNLYLDKLLDFLDERELLVSPEKSTVTLFSPDTKEYKIHPQVFLRDKLVPLENKPKLLGVVFDSLHKFCHHVQSSINKTKPKINILKNLAGTDWGQDKKTLVNTYKSIGRSVLEYGCPIWSPIISPTHWQNLQTIQNQALRIATGCLKMSHQDHLHQETKVLPLQPHAQLITKQFLLSNHLPGHPGQKHLQRPPEARQMKRTARQHSTELNNIVPINDRSDFKRGLKSLHTSTVTSVISNYSNNRILNHQPPEIHRSELTLTRKARCSLSQLRSGFSKKVNEYNHRLNEEIANTCPFCHTSPHDVPHLFNCNNNPTELTTIDLWKKPVEVARFLKLDGDPDQE